MPRQLTRSRVVSLMAALLLTVFAGTGALAQGTQDSARVMRPEQVIVLDPGGSQLLGHGQLVGRRLSLELAQSVGDFVLLLVGPFGEVERLVGSEDADGALRLAHADGLDDVKLDVFFEGRNLDLVVVRKGRVRVPQPADGSAQGPDDGEPNPDPGDDDDPGDDGPDDDDDDDGRDDDGGPDDDSDDDHDDEDDGRDEDDDDGDADDRDDSDDDDRDDADDDSDDDDDSSDDDDAEDDDDDLDDDAEDDDD